MHYAWLIWSLILLGFWLAVYFALKNKESKREMLIISFWTSLFGFLEPLFVPEYWNPPSLFDLAQNTGFDLESFIFSFGVGGLVVVLYEKIFPVEHVSFSQQEKDMPRHKYHTFAILVGPAAFALLWAFSGMNPIYYSFIALMAGGSALLYCRPDLKQKMVVSAFIFMGFYFIYFFTLLAMFPGYVEAVWNFAVISGKVFFGVPLEELMFAFGFGFAWSGIYEHFRWYKLSAIK
ncbi:MAG: hypothetical protein HZC14_01890 [Candidatus Niyogibacteria bacterium]|nr:hypothetical protein [Candidatus Niyogibacteria bacterium]